MHIVKIIRETEGKGTYRALVQANGRTHTARVKFDAESDIEIGKTHYMLVAALKAPAKAFCPYYLVIEPVSVRTGKKYMKERDTVSMAWRAIKVASEQAAAGKFKSGSIDTVRDVAIKMPFFRSEAKEVMRAVKKNQKQHEKQSA